MPDRPPPRDKPAGTRVTDDVYNDAADRAKKEGRTLSAIIRSFLLMFGQGEWPSPPVLPDEDTRAAKRAKPKPPPKTKKRR